MAKNDNIVFIYKHHEHHEAPHGVWKLAYADLMTGMMAFFIFMWIINIVSSDQTSGLSKYFTPPLTSKTVQGIGLPNEGLDPNSNEGAKHTTLSVVAPKSTIPRFGEDYDGEREGKIRDNEIHVGTGKSNANPNPPDDSKLGSSVTKLQQSFIKRLKNFVTQNYIQIERIPEGIRIQLFEGFNSAMFKEPQGIEFSSFLERILEIVADIMNDEDYSLAIEGYSQYFYTPRGNLVTQWEIGRDRAFSVYKYFLYAGIDPERIKALSSFGDKKLLIAEAPENINNNRISVVVLIPEDDVSK